MPLAKRAFKSFIINTASRLAEFGLTFAISIILARSLGPEFFGKYAVVMTFCGLFALLASFGFEETLNALLPKNADDKKSQSALFSSFLGIRVIVLIIIAGLAFLLADPISAVMASPRLGDLIRLAIPFILVANVNTLFMFLLTGLFRFGSLAFTKILSLLLQLLGISVIFALGGGVAEVIVVLFLTNVVLLCIYIGLGRSYINWRPRGFPVLPALSFGLMVWLTNLVNFGLGKQSDIILMGFFRVTESEIGYYQTAYGAVNTFNMLLISGFIGVTLASFAEASRREKGILGEAWQLTVKAYGAIALPALLFSIVHARAIIVGVYSEAYAPAVLLFQVYASFMFFTKLLGGGNHITALYATERQKTAFIIRLSAGVGNVGLNLFFIPWLGALGALIATGFSQLAVVITELIVVKRFITTAFPIRFNLTLLFACVIGLLPGLVWRPQHLWGVVIIVVLYYIIIVTALRILKPLNLADSEKLTRVNPLLGRLSNYFASR
jgi:O-antigen/teichoic acid export membrane protein